MSADRPTREQVLAKWDSMTPRERDALVAEKVMGWADARPQYHQCCISTENGIRVFEPSTDISAAWEVVEKMHEWGGCDIGCYGKGDKKWYVVNTYTNTTPYQKQVNVTAPTAPLAICKAALLAAMGL